MYVRTVRCCELEKGKSVPSWVSHPRRGNPETRHGFGGDVHSFYVTAETRDGFRIHSSESREQK